MDDYGDNILSYYLELSKGGKMDGDGKDERIFKKKI